MLNYLLRLLICLSLLFPLAAAAQLAVTVSPVAVVGQKAVVKLRMKNNLADKIESARAVCFVLDEQGKIVGQSTKWVIGKIGLKPKDETTFNFVVNGHQPFTTTNLIAKVAFNRVILDSGPVTDVQHEVIVNAASK